MSNSSDPSPSPPSSGDIGDHNNKDHNTDDDDDHESKKKDTSTSSATTTITSPPITANDESSAAAMPVSTKPNAEAAVTSSTSSASLFDDGENTLEEAFALIQKGNQLQKQSQGDSDNFWEASFAYCKAQAILNNLALAATTTTTTTNNNIDVDVDSEETNKIRQLYQRQSHEYFFKARQALIFAMTQESTCDYENNTKNTTNDESLDMIYESLSDVNATDRLTLFARLYARESILLSQQQNDNNNNNEKNKNKNDDIDDTNNNDNDNVHEQQSLLEERLIKLNQSLPSGFKTSEERMRDINRGLNRLGLSSIVNIPTINTNASCTSLTIGPFSMLGYNQPSKIKSELDQVEDIIAQARDEVALQQQQYGGIIPDNMESGGIGGGGIGISGGTVPPPSLAQDVAATLLSGVDNNNDNDIDDDSLPSTSSSHNDDDDDQQQQVDLTVDDIRVIQEYVNEAQSQLAQLNIMLQLDGEHAEIEFDPSSGQHKLLQARKCLALANKKFNITILE